MNIEVTCEVCGRLAALYVSATHPYASCLLRADRVRSGHIHPERVQINESDASGGAVDRERGADAPVDQSTERDELPGYSPTDPDSY